MNKFIPTIEALNRIVEIERLREQCKGIKLPVTLSSRLKKDSFIRRACASTKIEGNPLSEAEARDIIDTYLLSQVGYKERRFFEYLKKKKIGEFTPVEMAEAMKVTNRTIINWCASLAKNGLIEPNLTGKRIRSYSVV